MECTGCSKSGYAWFLRKRPSECQDSRTNPFRVTDRSKWTLWAHFVEKRVQFVYDPCSGWHTSALPDHLILWHASGVSHGQASQNFIVCPSHLLLQICQPCISLHIIVSSQIQKCIAIGLRIPGMHATRWLASVLIVFLKRLADFMKTWHFVLFLHGQNAVFYIGIQN